MKQRSYRESGGVAPLLRLESVGSGPSGHFPLRATEMVEPHYQIRRATPDDADGVSMVLQSVLSERIHSAIDRAWTAGQQRSRGRRC